MERIKYKNSHKLKGIVDKVFVSDGDSVTEGQTLAIISTQGDQYEVLSHLDGIVKNVYIIESILVSHGDIIFDIYSKKDIKKMVAKDHTLGDTLRFSLKKAGYLDDDINEVANGTVEDNDLELDFELDEHEKERTMRFNSIGDNNKNNIHGDIPTDEHFVTNEIDDLNFGGGQKSETLEMNIPDNLDMLDDLTIDNNLLKKREGKKEVEPTIEEELTFKSNDVATPTEIMRDNLTKTASKMDDLDNSDLSFAQFQLPSTSTIAIERAQIQKEVEKAALKAAISYDSVTQAMDDFEITPTKPAKKGSDLQELNSDFNFEEVSIEQISKPAVNQKLVEDHRENVEEMKKANISQQSQMVSPESRVVEDLDEFKSKSASELSSMEETSTIEVIQKMEEQVKMEKKCEEVDISEEAMNKSFETKVSNSSFLSTFGNAGAQEQQVQSQQQFSPNKSETEALFNDLSGQAKEMDFSNEPLDETIIVDTKELNRIESLLNIDDFGDLDSISAAKFSFSNVVEPTPTRVQSVASQPVANESHSVTINQNEVSDLISSRTGHLSSKINNQDEMIKDLSEKVDDLLNKKPIKTAVSLKTTVVNSMLSEFTFQTNVTALMNLHSILVEPFSAKGINLTIGDFVALAIAKTVSKNDIETDGLTFNWIEDLNFCSTKIRSIPELTISDIASSAAMRKMDEKIKTAVSVYDLSNSIVSSANISNGDVLTIVIGKIKEDDNLTGTLTTKVVFDKDRFSLDDALKFVYAFNALIENPGFLI